MGKIMKSIALISVLSLLVGCTSRTITQDGDTASVIIETSLPFRSTRDLISEARRIVCQAVALPSPEGGRHLSIEPEIHFFGVTSKFSKSASELHDAVVKWIGKTTVKVNGKCSIPNPSHNGGKAKAADDAS